MLATRKSLILSTLGLAVWSGEACEKGLLIVNPFRLFWVFTLFAILLCQICCEVEKKKCSDILIYCINIICIIFFVCSEHARDIPARSRFPGFSCFPNYQNCLTLPWLVPWGFCC